MKAASLNAEVRGQRLEVSEDDACDGPGDFVVCSPFGKEEVRG